MADSEVSRWAEARFGASAADLALTVPAAIRRAHQRAMDAHAAAELETNDTYGVTLHVAQHEELVRLARGIEGVAIRKPKDVSASRFSFVVVDETAVVLYPWRYATDRRTEREQAKLRTPVSGLRKTLLTLAPREIGPQLTLDDLERGYADLEAELAEERAALEQLRRFGRVVAIGYASNPSAGLFDLGWGDLDLVDEASGEVTWPRWEPFLLDDGQAGEEGGTRFPRAPGSPPEGSGHEGRFDDAPLSEDFGLALRPPLSPTPISEPERAEAETGTDDPESGDGQ